MKNDGYELLMKIIKKRRSIRRFKPDVPGKELILKLIDAARYAPSATNFQPWKFFVITNPGIKNKMVGIVLDKLDRLAGMKQHRNREMIGGKDIKEFGREYFMFFGNAPVIIAAFIKPYPLAAEIGSEIGPEEKEKKLLLSVESTSAGVQNLLLAAHALGLGACWIDGPLIAKNELESMLGAKAPWSLMCLVALGYSEQDPPTPRRKKVEHIIKFLE